MPGTVIHIPHASDFIPAGERPQFALSDADLSLELIRVTDRYTDHLFDLPEDVATKVVFGYSRLLVDPERFRAESDEPMAARGMGAVYRKTSHGADLRHPFTETEREKLLARYYDPHHESMTRAVDAALTGHGGCLILDAHSFPSHPLPCDMSQQMPRPDICIGTDAFHTPADLRDRAVALFQSAGLRVEIDHPYAGAFVPISFYGRDPRVNSIMVEINRRLYMDEATGAKRADYDSFAATLRTILTRLIAG